MGVPKEGSMDGWGSQNMGNPKRREEGWMGDPNGCRTSKQRDPKGGGAPEYGEQGWMGVPKREESQTMGDLKG